MNNSICKQKIDPLPFSNPKIVEVINLNQLMIGPQILEFEKSLTEIFSFKYCITVSNGFSALFLSIKALELSNKKIIVPAISTCWSISNAVIASGNIPLFCKLDSNHLSLSIIELEKCISNNSNIGAIIAPSYFGIPAPVKEYKLFNIPIIEDSCQSFHTRTKIKSEADFLVLSFYPTKQVNCIDGGAILLNDLSLKIEIEKYRYYNGQISFDIKPHYNLRMPNLNCAFGIIQIKRLQHIQSHLSSLKKRYIEEVANSEIWITDQVKENVFPWRLIAKIIDTRKLNLLEKANIPLSKEFLWTSNEKIDSQSINLINIVKSIPYYQLLTEVEQMFIINILNK